MSNNDEDCPRYQLCKVCGAKDCNCTPQPASEIDSLRQQLTECQAALALKDEALQKIVPYRAYNGDDWPAKIAEEAITIKPDNTALREWGARLLEAFDDEVHSGNGKAVNRVIRDFRSGKWPPEVLK